MNIRSPPELPRPSSFSGFASHRWVPSPLLWQASLWPETSTCPVPSGSHYCSQTSSRTLSQKCPWQFTSHIPEQDTALRLIFPFASSGQLGGEEQSRLYAYSVTPQRGVGMARASPFRRIVLKALWRLFLIEKLFFKSYHNQREHSAVAPANNFLTT